MNDTQSLTESLLEIVQGINKKSIMLPEFQRDFRWELDQSYDLFDSLIRDIFIGTIIYGKPSFAMTLREIDQRPRKGKGSNAPLKTIDYSSSEITKLAQTQNLRVVLDGQQRITSIYRALVGLDSVYIILKNGLDASTISQLSLEAMVEYVGGDESKTAISVRLQDAYEAEVDNLEEDDLNLRFAKSAYAQTNLKGVEELDRKASERIYRRALRKLIDLFKQQKMVSYYLLDMNLDKFCLFFERSNSRGIQLNFTDILAAKLYHGFNLRKKIEEFEGQSKFRLNREIIVRAIAYIVAVDRKGAIAIDKKFILEHLEAEDFQKHWDNTCRYYTESLQYLANQNYILSQDWMPSENMIIPLMMFLRHVKGYDRISEDQRKFLEFWYWSSVFANRYVTSSNEVIITDGQALTQVARGEKIQVRGFFNRMRNLISEPEDLFSYTKKTSTVYRGVLNLLGYVASGLSDWNSTHKIDVSMRLEDHHIYPRGYIASFPKLEGMEQSQAEQLVDSVVNRTLIPKILNIQVGKRPPSAYLGEIKEKVNPYLSKCLESHLLPTDMINDSTWDTYFWVFLQERAEKLYRIIESYTSEKAGEMLAKYGTQVDVGEVIHSNGNKVKLKDLIAAGKVCAGEKVYTRRKPTEFASIIDGEYVDYKGNKLLINTWGQQMTGWSSINIYDSILLERTGQPLRTLRS